MGELESIAGKIPNWLRWPLIPVTAILTAIVVWFAASLLAKILVFFDGGRGWGENFFQYLIIPGLASFSSVLVGTTTAPRFRTIVALTLAALYVFAAGTLTFFSIFSGMWANLIMFFSIFIGCTAAALSFPPEPAQNYSNTEPLPDVNSAD